MDKVNLLLIPNGGDRSLIQEEDKMLVSITKDPILDDNNNNDNISSTPGEHEFIITPLIENLDNLQNVDPNLLIKPDEVNQFPIGMNNFKSKIKYNRSSPNLKSFTKYPTVEDAKQKSKLIREKWRKAAMKIKLLKDPWYEFHLESYPIEQVTRHRYNPLKKTWKKDKCFVKMETKQFANGAMRACFRLKKLSNFSHDKSWRSASNYVAKSYKSDEIPRERYFDDVRLQMDAKLWAEVFNRHNPPKKIDMFQVSILEFDNREGSPLFHLEHYIEGNYIKYNSNAGFVEDVQMRYTPHAFSHFTFECSNHELIVVDIQGVGDLYTDPQIHTANGNDYGDGNLGVKGFALFFYSHVCNDICKSLGLTEFDLAPNEKISHTALMKCLKNTAGLTKRRGHEEPLFNPSISARTRYLMNKMNSYNSDECNDLIEIDETPLGFNFSSSLSVYSHNSNISPKSNQAFSFGTSFGNNSAIHGHMLSVNNNSNNTSMVDCPFNNEEFKYLASNLNKPRPSGVVLEKNAILNADTEFMRKIHTLGSYESILGKVHLEMCKYHENGRFLTNENDSIDNEAAFFHLQQSANLGVTEALINIAKIYMQFPHDILPDYSIDVSKI